MGGVSSLRFHICWFHSAFLNIPIGSHFLSDFSVFLSVLPACLHADVVFAVMYVRVHVCSKNKRRVYVSESVRLLLLLLFLSSVVSAVLVAVDYTTSLL